MPALEISLGVDLLFEVTFLISYLYVFMKSFTMGLHIRNNEILQ